MSILRHVVRTVIELQQSAEREDLTPPSASSTVQRVSLGSSCHWKAPTLPRNVKFKFSGFSGIANGLVELFLDPFDFLVALTKPMRLMKNGEQGSDFSIVNARILKKTQMW